MCVNVVRAMVLSGLLCLSFGIQGEEPKKSDKTEVTDHIFEAWKKGKADIGECIVVDGVISKIEEGDTVRLETLLKIEDDKDLLPIEKDIFKDTFSAFIKDKMQKAQYDAREKKWLALDSRARCSCTERNVNSGIISCISIFTKAEFREKMKKS